MFKFNLRINFTKYIIVTILKETWTLINSVKVFNANIIS